MSRNLLQELHKDFCIVDRKAIEGLHRELVRNLEWQEKAIRIIRKLRNGKQKNKRDNNTSFSLS